MRYRHETRDAGPGSAAVEAIRRAWPTVAAHTISRLVATASVDEAAGRTILPEGELPGRVALVLRGTVGATWSAPDGRLVFAGLYGPGQFMGLATLSGGPAVVSMTALSRVTLLTWPSHEFRATAEADTALALDLLDRSVYAIHALNDLIKRRTFTSAASRLAGLLLQYEALCFAKDRPLISRPYLTTLAAVSPEMVRRILHRWEAAGIVRRPGRTGLELIDRSALEAEAAPLAAFPPPDPSIRGAWTAPTLEG